MQYTQWQTVRTMDNWNNWNNSPPLNSDSFRNHLLDRPSVMTKNLQFLLIHDEHNAILGGTSMTDIFWTGALWHFNDISDLNRERAAITQEVDTGVCDAVYLDQSKFVVVDDSGAVQIFEITAIDEVPQLQSIMYACQHDSSALTVSLFPERKNIVTAGTDYCMKIWNLDNLSVTYSFPFAHADIITCVDAKPTCNSTIASASLDGESLLWDIRCDKAARTLLRRKESQLMSVTWNPNVDHLVAIGTDNGDVMLVDVRQTSGEDDSVLSWITCDRGVHKLLFNPNPEKKEQLACCFDNTTVNIFDSYRELLELYNDNSHSDFVQGLAWYKDELFSCAWDGTVNKHNVSSDFDDKSVGGNVD